MNTNRFGLVPPEAIPTNTSTQVDGSRYLAYFREQTKNFIFRRVSRVYTKEENYLGTLYCTHDGIFNAEDVLKGRNPTKFEFEHNIEHHYKEFSFSTTGMQLRDNDIYSGPISGSSHNFSYINLETWHLEFALTPAPPRIGDLICGLIDTNSSTKLQYFRWFVCSEQLYRTWSILHYGTSNFKILEFRFSDRYDLKKKLFSGNRLCTANYKKFIMRCELSGIKPSEEEKTKRFYRLRTEPVSVQYIHFYAALVLLLHYNERPNSNNVPKNLDVQLPENITEWDLPEGWIGNLYLTRKITLKLETVEVTKLERTERPNRRDRKLEEKLDDENSFPPLTLM
jgi:hypothetical protein